MKLSEKKKLYVRANDVYNNQGRPLMTDVEFDRLEAEIKKADPNWEYLRKTGAKVANKKTEIRLSEPMPSLSKNYPETIEKWIAKHGDSYIVSHKLDGSALQVKYDKGRPVQVVTRGDGVKGGDISFLIPHLNLPKIKIKDEVLLRCEAVMKNIVFHNKWSTAALGKKLGFDNPRNTVNGWLNRMTPHKGLKDVDILVLGVYGLPYEEGLTLAYNQGLHTTSYFPLAKKAQNADSLGALLRSERKKSAYDIDGLVLVPRSHQFFYENADRPKWTTAFKVNEDDDAVEASVTEIVWQESRTGRWTPKIKVKPIKMKGVTVTYATAHNAKWMNDRKIGVDAVVKLVRSGDVIPKIVGVVKAAKVPSVPPGEFYEKGVHYYAMERGKEADVREIHHFLQVLGIENLARKGVATLYDSGLTSVLHHVQAYGTRMKPYVKADFGQAMTSKIFAEMDRVFRDDGVTLLKLMNASNCFESFGERKLQMIEDHFAKKGDADILRVYVQMKVAQLEDSDQLARIEAIKGLGKESAKQFFEGLMKFKLWFAPIAKLKLIRVVNPVPKKEKKSVKGILTGSNISFTGYRDKEHEAWVEAQGGTIVPFGSKTTILLYKESGKASSKVDKARHKGITVYTFDELKKKCK